MNIKNIGFVVLSSIMIFSIAGCSKNEVSMDDSISLGAKNPAPIYCEQNGGTLNSEEGLCMFSDGSYCEEGSFLEGKCQPGEIIYNTVSDDVISENTASYSDEDISAAEAAIVNVVQNEWDVKIESFNISYVGDERSSQNLRYCKSLDPRIEECIVFTSNFHIPEQDAEMAGAFEPNSDITGYDWYVGRSEAGEWEILTNGFG